MTLTLEISPEVERELTRAAAASGRALSEWIVETARAVAARPASDEEETEKRRLQAIAQLHGMCAGRSRTVDDFLAERHAEGEAEYDKWIAGRNARAAAIAGENA